MPSRVIVVFEPYASLSGIEYLTIDDEVHRHNRQADPECTNSCKGTSVWRHVVQFFTLRQSVGEESGVFGPFRAATLADTTALAVACFGHVAEVATPWSDRVVQLVCREITQRAAASGYMRRPEQFW